MCMLISFDYDGIICMFIDILVNFYYTSLFDVEGARYRETKYDLVS